MVEWDVDSSGNPILPGLLVYRSALHQSGVALRVECTSADLIAERQPPQTFQFAMSPDRARDLAHRLLTLAGLAEGSVGMTPQ